VSEQLLTPLEVQAAGEAIAKLKKGLNSVLLDQTAVVDRVTTAILARGHVLLEGLPGLGKTELCKGLARLLGLPFKRVQFTPDLLPADITGTYVFNPDTKAFTFRQEPLFASVVLADEINRSSPKTQSALLEAMQERSVTVLGTTHALPQPFFVLATQNPIELEGTYPLPEAQLDRFMFRVLVPPVGAKTMASILTSRVRGQPPALEAVTDGPGLATLFALVDRVHLPMPVAEFIGRLVEGTHPSAGGAPDSVRRFVRYGASPRAALALAASARAWALAKGKPNVGFDEVKEMASAVLNHRVGLGSGAGLGRFSAGMVAEQILSAVPEVARG